MNKKAAVKKNLIVFTASSGDQSSLPYKDEKMVLAVGGCVAQAEGAEIMRRAPYVDLVFGPQTYHRLPEMIARAHRSQDKKEGDESCHKFTSPSSYQSLKKGTYTIHFSRVRYHQSFLDKQRRYRFPYN